MMVSAERGDELVGMRQLEPTDMHGIRMYVLVQS